jgi:hypothetical protein
MARTLDEVIGGLPKARRVRIEARARELIAEEMSLRDLRKAMKRTQAAIAIKIGVGQDSVSRMEQRDDVLLSTLRGYVRAMGGELSLIARFPNRPPVELTNLRGIAATEAEPKGPARPRR